MNIEGRKLNNEYKQLNDNLNALQIKNKDLLYRLQKCSFRDFVEVFEWPRKGLYQGIEYYFQQNNNDKYRIDVWDINEKRHIGNLYCFNVWFTKVDDFERHEQICDFAEIPEKKIIWLSNSEITNCDSCNKQFDINHNKKYKCHTCPSYYCNDCYKNFPNCKECNLLICPSCSIIECNKCSEIYHANCEIDHHIRCH